MSNFDDWFQQRLRGIAQMTSRRHFLTRLGALMVGGAILPLLPVERAMAIGSPKEKNDPTTKNNDPTSCEYWRYCGLGGQLCSCCGGSADACPPGTEKSPVLWIGTCENPADKKRYVVGYHDCCGKSGCGRCMCTGEDGILPLYRPAKNSEVNWCIGTESSVYNCTIAALLEVPE